LRLLTLNIGAASAERAVTIWNWLSLQDADVMVLTETSHGLGTRWLVEQSRASGLDVIQNDCGCGGRGVIVISRLPLEIVNDNSLSVSDQCRLTMGMVACRPSIQIVGMYAHSRNRGGETVDRKKELLKEVLQVLRELEGQQDCVFGGDFNVMGTWNTVRHGGFLPFETRFLADVERMGYLDASARYPEENRYSWVGRTGNRYQYDYWYVSASLSDRVQRCDYLHETRTSLRISDHSAVMLDISVEMGISQADKAVDQRQPRS
jgi:exodeoxyribonuclease-3